MENKKGKTLLIVIILILIICVIGYMAFNIINDNKTTNTNNNSSNDNEVNEIEEEQYTIESTKIIKLFSKTQAEDTRTLLVAKLFNGDTYYTKDFSDSLKLELINNQIDYTSCRSYCNKTMSLDEYKNIFQSVFGTSINYKVLEGKVSSIVTFKLDNNQILIEKNEIEGGIPTNTSIEMISVESIDDEIDIYAVVAYVDVNGDIYKDMDIDSYIKALSESISYGDDVKYMSNKVATDDKVSDIATYKDELHQYKFIFKYDKSIDDYYYYSIEQAK